MIEQDLLDWLGTPLGIQDFVAVARFLATERQYALLLRWASRREPHLTEAEIDEVESLARLIGELIARWEAVEVPAA